MDLESVAMGAALDFARAELERNEFARFHRQEVARREEFERGLVAAELREQRLKAQVAGYEAAIRQLVKNGGSFEVTSDGYSMDWPR